MKEQVEKILSARVENSHLFVADVSASPGRINVSLDGDMGVNINECATISRFLHEKLEEQGVDTGKYIIEVSSPGIDRPLKLLREFKKNVGRKLQVRNAQGKTIKGTLALADEERIMLSAGPKKEILNYSQIKEAKVVI